MAQGDGGVQLSFGADAPSVSIVTVFNKPDVVERCLLASLRRQAGASFEWIGVDNTAHAYPAAAHALNAGARRARGDILLFTHQDVSLYGEEWVAGLERWMRSLGDVGVAGVVGPRPRDGMMLGYLKDRKAVSGHPLAVPAEVQTLDECVLAMRRDVWERHPFDETIGGWHVYGVDACLRTRAAGLRCYALPLFVHHDSAAVNLAGLAEAHRRIQRKHGAAEGAIYSTCGVLPTRAGRVRELASRSVRAARRAVLRRPANDFLAVVQRLADGVERLVVLDFFAGASSREWPLEVAAEALDGKARSSRPVLHRVVPADEPAGALDAWLRRQLPAPLMLFNLPQAEPGALDALPAALEPGAPPVWTVYPRSQRNAVRELAAARGWEVVKERRTVPYLGPGPLFVSELRRRAA